MNKILLSLTALLGAALYAGAAEPVRIGAAAAIRGRAEALKSEARPAARTLAGGDPVYLNDRISTGENGQVQIMLLDETVFTVGPNSAVVLDKFVYDPGSGAGEVSADVVKGYFRFVTGKVAKKNPAGVKVKVAAGTIGVFGTIVSGAVNGDQALVVLEGPGALNNAGERAGRIEVQGPSGAPVTVSRPGYAVTVGPQGVSDAYRPEPELLRDLGTALVPGTRARKEEAEAPYSAFASAEYASGMAAGTGLEGLQGMSYLAWLGDDLDSLGSETSQNLSGFTNPGWDDVRRITGTAVLATGAGAGFLTPGSVCTGGILNCMGTWDYSLNINFDTRSILASASIVSTSINDTITNVPVSYTALTGDAVFSVPTTDNNGSYTWTFSNMGWNTYDITVEGSCTYNSGADEASCVSEFVSR